MGCRTKTTNMVIGFHEKGKLVALLDVGRDL